MNFDVMISLLIRSNWLFVATWIAMLAGATAAGFRPGSQSLARSDSKSRRHYSFDAE